MKEPSELCNYQNNNSQNRKVYCSPLLKEMGSISEITQGGGTQYPDGGATQEGSGT